MQAARSLLLLRAVALVLTASGCLQTGQESPDEIRAKTACVLLCKLELQKGSDLSEGPCISDGLDENEAWVCDVVHSPRAAADDLPENQCPSFGFTASHFVEVDEYCELIRAV